MCVCVWGMYRARVISMVTVRVVVVAVAAVMSIGRVAAM